MPLFFGGGGTLAEEVTVVKELSVFVERDFRWIVGQDAGNADKDHVGMDGVPVVGPGFHVHNRGIVLGHVGLADASNALLPWFCGRVGRGQTGGKSDQGSDGWLAEGGDRRGFEAFRIAKHCAGIHRQNCRSRDNPRSKKIAPRNHWILNFCCASSVTREAVGARHSDCHITLALRHKWMVGSLVSKQQGKCQYG